MPPVDPAIVSPQRDVRETCGTHSGYNTHLYYKEPPCRDCTTAHTAYNNYRYKVVRQAVALLPLTTPVLRDRCGTTAGYQAHRRRQEFVCEACLSAHHTANTVYAASHKEAKAKADAIWSANNGDKVRAKGRKRRALRLGNGHEPYTEVEILGIWGTDCYLCGEPIDLDAPRRPGIPGWERGLHMEHVTPLSKGGEDTSKNVRPAHGGCNLVKGSKEHEES